MNLLHSAVRLAVLTLSWLGATSHAEAATGAFRSTRTIALLESDDDAARLRRELQGLFSTQAQRRRYFLPALSPLVEAVTEMASWNAAELRAIADRFRVVDTHLELVDRTLDDDVEHADSHAFCREALGILRGGFNAEVDLLARNAETAYAGMAGLGAKINGHGDWVFLPTTKPIDDADASLDTRAFMVPAIEDARWSLIGRLAWMGQRTLGDVQGANDSFCRRFTPDGWTQESDPQIPCPGYADAGDQAVYAFTWLDRRVRRDPWLDVGRGRRERLAGSWRALRSLARRLDQLAGSVPPARRSQFATFTSDLNSARAGFLDASSHLREISERDRWAPGDRKSQELLEASRRAMQALYWFGQAYGELFNVAPPVRTRLWSTARKLAPKD